MANMFNTSIATIARSFLDRLQPVIGYNPSQDPRDEHGNYISDGTEAVTIDVSFPSPKGGKGNAVVKMTAADSLEIAQLVEDYDPTGADESIPDNILAAVKSTLSVTRDTHGRPELLTFKTSLRPHTRAVQIPWDQRAQFVEWLRTVPARTFGDKTLQETANLSKCMNDWISYCRERTKLEEREDRRKARVGSHLASAGVVLQNPPTVAADNEPTAAGTALDLLSDDSDE